MQKESTPIRPQQPPYLPPDETNRCELVVVRHLDFTWPHVLGEHSFTGRQLGHLRHNHTQSRGNTTATNCSPPVIYIKSLNTGCYSSKVVQLACPREMQGEQGQVPEFEQHSSGVMKQDTTLHNTTLHQHAESIHLARSPLPQMEETSVGPSCTDMEQAASLCISLCCIAEGYFVTRRAWCGVCPGDWPRPRRGYRLQSSLRKMENTKTYCYITSHGPKC